LDLWASILSRVPESRIVIKSGIGRHRDKVIERIGRQGLSLDQVKFVGRQPIADYWATYNGIDLALDPFPYPGGTTTCDAMWMGVPVVTLAGETAVQRSGVSILSNVGMREW